MRGRRLILPLAVLAGLALPSPASAILNGETVEAGDFPAHGFLGVDTSTVPDGHVDAVCGGTLVGSRQFLTAARCVTNSLGQKRSTSRLTVRVGVIPLPDDTIVADVVNVDIPGGYIRSTGQNDVAMLTLTGPVDAEPVRVVDLGEEALWSPGTSGAVLGWGETSLGGDIADTLLQGSVAIREDDACGVGFDATVMLCAASPAADDRGDPCPQDSGSPLLVPDGALLALAGVFSGAACASDGSPGRFARIGDDPLNKWVHDRTPEANFALSHQPRATEPVTLTSTSTYPPAGPEGDDFFNTVKWDLDGDGDFDRSGKQISHAFPAAGTAIVGIQASNAQAGDKAIAYFSFLVEPAPAQQQQQTTAPPAAAPPAVNPVAGPLATILVSGRPKVRKRRFALRVRFAAGAPRGIAVIEVYRGKRRIGIARTKVRRGATKRVRVKLTPQGRRILRRAASKRLRIRVRVRVGRDVLRTKRITIRAATGSTGTARAPRA